MLKVAGYRNSYNDSYYFNYPKTAAYHNEATTIWVAGDATGFAKHKVQIVEGDGKIENYTRLSTIHTFNVDAKGNVSVLDNTTYFPGWQVYVDKVKTPIEFQNQNARGLITFDVLEGKHEVVVKFSETKIRLLSDIISIATIILVVGLFIFRKRFNKIF